MERKLKFKYDLYGEGHFFSVYSGDEKVFTFEEALKKGVIKEVARKEEIYEFRPGYLEVKYRIVPTPYGIPDSSGNTTVIQKKDLPPLELDRILEEKERLKESIKEMAKKGREVELELRKLKRELYYCVRPRIETLIAELDRFDVSPPEEIEEGEEERVENELFELKERERELKEKIENLEREHKKELAAVQLYRSILDTGEKEYWEDPFILPDYLLELLEVSKAGSDEVMEKVEELVGWMPDTPQGLAFGLMFVGKVYGIRPKTLDLDKFKERPLSVEVAGDLILEEVENFQEWLRQDYSEDIEF